MNSVKKFVFDFRIIWFLLLGQLANGRVTPRVSNLAPKSIFSEPTKAIPGPEKNYTGIRVRPDSLILLYHHEQTVAIVEVAPNRALFNCELLEVRTNTDKQATLNNLKPVIPTQMKIAFSDMIDLMNQCQKLDLPPNPGFVGKSSTDQSHSERRQFTSIFSGVFPDMLPLTRIESRQRVDNYVRLPSEKHDDDSISITQFLAGSPEYRQKARITRAIAKSHGTKWCGAGDIATSYHDLGPDRELDKCCRSHDLCPVKVAGLRTQYNLTNYAIYTRSHCVCDDHFYDCLKSVGTSVSGFLGGIYFNVTPLTCVEDVEDPVLKTKKRFTIKNKRF